MEIENSGTNRKKSHYKYVVSLKKTIDQTEKTLLEPWEYNSLCDDEFPSAADIIRYFGSWEQALSTFNYDISKTFVSGTLPNPPTEYKMCDFTNSVKRYYEKNRELPKMEDMYEIDYFPSSTAYKEYFDDWGDVIRAAGYIPSRDYTDEELLIVLQKTARKVEGAMSIRKYKEVKKSHYPSEGPYNNRFNGWKAAKKKFVLGNIPNKYDCIEEIQNVAEKLGHPPTQAQYQVHSASNLSVPIVLHYLDNWDKALTESNLCPNETRQMIHCIREFYETTPWSIIRQNFQKSGNDIIYCPFCNGEYKSSGDVGTHLQRSHNQIYKQALLDEIRYLKSKFETLPSLQLLQSDGVFQRSAYESNYGSWNSAVEDAGLEPFKRPEISKESLIKDIQRVSEEELDGKTPRVEHMDKFGKHHPETYRRYFDYKFWRALEEAGLEPAVRRNISREYLLDEIRRVDALIDRTPPRLSDIEEYGKCVPSNYFKTEDGSDYFDSWNDALIEAGFEPSVRHDHDIEEVLQDFQNIVEELGQIPIEKEFSERVKYSSSLARRMFGSWNSLIREAGYEPPHRKSIPDKELLDEIHRLYEQKDRAPTLSEMSEGGKFSIMAYKRAFGDWTKAVEKAGYEPIMKATGELHADWKPDADNEYYGPNWREQRAKCIGRDGRECRVCEKTQREIGCEPSVHHIRPRSTYENENYQEMNRLDNLIALCPSCHGKFEGRWQGATPEKFERKAKEEIKSQI